MRDIWTECETFGVKLHFVSWIPPHFCRIFFVHKLPPFRYQVELNISSECEVSCEILRLEKEWTKIPIPTSIWNPHDGVALIDSLLTFLNDQI